MTKNISKISFNNVFEYFFNQGQYCYPLINLFVYKKIVDDIDLLEIQLLMWNKNYREAIEKVNSIFKVGVLDNRKKYLLHIIIMKAYFFVDKKKSKYYFIKLKNSYTKIPKDLRKVVATCLKSYCSLDDGNFNFNIWGKYLEEDENDKCFYKIALARAEIANKNYFDAYIFYAQAVRSALISGHQTGILTSFNNFHFLIFEKFFKYSNNLVEFHKFLVPKTFSDVRIKLYNIATLVEILEKNDKIKCSEFLIIAEYYFKDIKNLEKHKKIIDLLKFKYRPSVRGYELDNKMIDFISKNVSINERTISKIKNESLKKITSNFIIKLFPNLDFKDIENLPYPIINEIIKIRKKEKAINILKTKDISKIDFISAYIVLVNKLDNFSILFNKIGKIFRELKEDKKKLIKRIDMGDNELAFLICLLDKSDGFYKARMDIIEKFLKNIDISCLDFFIDKYISLTYLKKDIFEKFIKNYVLYFNSFNEFKFDFEKKVLNFCNKYGLNTHSAMISLYCFDKKERRILNTIFEEVI